MTRVTGLIIHHLVSLLIRWMIINLASSSNCYLSILVFGRILSDIVSDVTFIGRVIRHHSGYSITSQNSGLWVWIRLVRMFAGCLNKGSSLWCISDLKKLLTHSLTHSLTRSFINSLTHSFCIPQEYQWELNTYFLYSNVVRVMLTWCQINCPGHANLVPSKFSRSC